MENLSTFMKAAIEEAIVSLREGNHGFGSVIVYGGEIIAKSHDREETDNDPTSHAEINTIKIASGKIGKNLKNCMLISTHEPCPMCAAAIVWSGMEKIGYGYSIGESIKEGRIRIDLSCEEIFHRSKKDIHISKSIMHSECKILYNKEVRNEIKRLRNITPDKLKDYNADSIKRRIDWFNDQKDSFHFINGDFLNSAYELLMCRFGIESTEAPIVDVSKNRITFHSKNFCPTLEACKILNYDTRYICRHYNENSTDVLIKQIDKRLQFARNYEKLRPYTDYCEEMIILN